MAHSFEVVSDQSAWTVTSRSQGGESCDKAFPEATIGLAAWAVGLVLGVRNFSQQGMFLIGGTLADRLGYKPLIIAGCLLRTGGFALLVVANSLPGVLIASAATGFAGALFNPAVRAYLAADAGRDSRGPAGGTCVDGS